MCHPPLSGAFFKFRPPGGSRLPAPSLTMPSTPSFPLISRLMRKGFAPWTAPLTLLAFVSAQLPTPAYAAPATAVLGLDGSPKKQAKALTESIRRAFARRGMNVGTRLGFAEYRLMMNCAEDNFRCLARSSQALNADRLLFGRIDYQDDKPVLTLRWLDTNSTRLIQSRIFHLSQEQISPKSIDTTGAAIAEALILDRPIEVETPVPVEDPAALPIPDPQSSAAGDTQAEPRSKAQRRQASSEPAAQPPRNKRLDRRPSGPSTDPSADSDRQRFRKTKQKKRDQPLWPAVGLGVSLPLALGAWGVAIWSRKKLASNGPIRQQLFKAADDSLLDSDPDNDVNKMRDGDLCEFARIRSGSSNKVRNQKMVDLCNYGDRLRNTNTLVIVGGAVLSSAAGFFVGALIHYNRNKKSSKRAQSRKKVDFQGAWLPGQGLSGSATFRF